MNMKKFFPCLTTLLQKPVHKWVTIAITTLLFCLLLGWIEICIAYTCIVLDIRQTKMLVASGFLGGVCTGFFLLWYLIGRVYREHIDTLQKQFIEVVKMFNHFINKVTEPSQKPRVEGDEWKDL